MVAQELKAVALLSILAVIITLGILVALVNTQRKRAVNVSQIEGREVPVPRQVPVGGVEGYCHSVYKKPAQRRQKKSSGHHANYQALN